MKIEDLVKLGVTEEIAKKIVEQSDAELAAETQKVSDKDAELKTAKDSLKDLTDKVKAFDGVDVNKLKTDLADAQAKYNSDIASLKLDNAVSLALGTSGALDSDIVKSLIDKSIVKLDDSGKLIGFNEQLEKIKTDKAFLFGAKDLSLIHI